MSNRNCTVISTYFGERRTSPSGVDATIEYLDDFLEYLKELDSGVDSDIILVNHACPDGYDPEGKSLKFLSKFDGAKTINGEIKVVNRGREVRGLGRSFKSFDHAFNLFKNDYEYWFFIEDDVGISLSNYFLYCIKQLEEEEKNNVAYICANNFGFGTSYARHCYGGAGCTHRKYLEEIVKKNGHLPFCHEDDIQPQIAAYRCNEVHGEVDFTNILIREGYELSLFNSQKYANDKKIVISPTGHAATAMMGVGLLNQHVTIKTKKTVESNRLPTHLEITSFRFEDLITETVTGTVAGLKVVDGEPSVLVNSEFYSLQDIIDIQKL